MQHDILKRFQFPFLGHFIPFGATGRVLNPRMGSQFIAGPHESIWGLGTLLKGTLVLWRCPRNSPSYQMNSGLEPRSRPSPESNLGWVMNWNGREPRFRSGLSHWGYGRSFQRKSMDPEPERRAEIFKLKRLKGRGLAPKNNSMSERRRGLNLPGQTLPVLNRENCRTRASWGR